MSRRTRAWAATLLVAALLVGCAPAEEGEPDVDLVAIQTELSTIDGVVESSTGVRNTGAPGAYALRLQLVVDEAGLAAIGDVLQRAVDDVAAAASVDRTYREFEFAVSVVDSSSPTGTRRVTLSSHGDRIAIDEGTLTTSLTLTADELAAAAR